MSRAVPGALRALAAASLVAALVAAPSTAVARSCQQLAGVVTSDSQPVEILLLPPPGWAGTAFGDGAVTVQQDGIDLPVNDLWPAPARLLDVVIVLDVSSAAEARLADVRAAAQSLIAGLPPKSSAAVVTTGDRPRLAQPLDRDLALASAAVGRLSAAGPPRLLDALNRAIQEHRLDPARQQHVVAIATGPDQGSLAEWPAAAAAMQRRGIAFDLIDLGEKRALPAAGPQCSAKDGPVVAPDQAGRDLATSLVSAYRVSVQDVDTSQPLIVTLSRDGESVSTILRPRGPTAVEGSTFGQSGSSVAGVGVLLAGILLGFAMLLVVVLLVLWRTPRGALVGAALRNLVGAWWVAHGERRVPDERRRVPRAEGRRRLADARHDVSAAIMASATARDEAEVAAYEEEQTRQAAAEREQAARQRRAGRDRAVRRRELALLRGRELMAVQRARDERLQLQNAGTMLPIEAAAAAERERARMVEAATRLAAEERAAAEALLKARLSDEQPAPEPEPATIEIPEASATAAPTEDTVEAAPAVPTPPAPPEEAAAPRSIDLRVEEVARIAAARTAGPPVVSVPVTEPAPAAYQPSEDGVDVDDGDDADDGDDDEPADLPPVQVQEPRPTSGGHRGRPQGRDRAARLGALALLPVAFVAKTAVTGAWWQQARWPLLAAGAVLAVAGVRWVWWATRPPRALLPAHRRRLNEERLREMSQVTQARMLLASLGTGQAPEAVWRDFEETTGLVVAGALRRTVHPDMDPGAFVRYVRNRQPVAPPRPASIESIAGIFVVLVCLPVLVLVLLA